MQINAKDRKRGLWDWTFAALCAVLAMGLGLMASPAEAAPFAYVANANSNNVSVIDTATNSVVATVPLGFSPAGVAVTPDGKHVYVTDSAGVAVIDTATNLLVATVPVGNSPHGVAITPDGNHAYVANGGSNTVSVIDTATNMEVGLPIPIPVGTQPANVAVTPDGKRAYVTNRGAFPNVQGTVSVIDTASNAVVATVMNLATPAGVASGVAITPDGKDAYVTVDQFVADSQGAVLVIDTASNTVVASVSPAFPLWIDPEGVAITPDGKHAYVFERGAVFVIDTASNTRVAAVPVGSSSGQGMIAITPDGKHVYVTNSASSTVSVIGTATNTVIATVGVGSGPAGVGIVPPPPGVPFLAFNAKLAIQFGSIPTKDAFGLGSNFTLSSTAPAINPLSEPVTLQVSSFATTIPPGSFKKQQDGSFAFKGVIDGVNLEALIKRTGTLRYAFQAKATGANLTGTVNTVYATLIIGGDSGATSVTAEISP